MPTQPILDPEKPCAECGRFGAVEMGDVALCLDCYAEKGACCANEETTPDCEDGQRTD